MYAAAKPTAHTTHTTPSAQYIQSKIGQQEAPNLYIIHFIDWIMFYLYFYVLLLYVRVEHPSICTLSSPLCIRHKVEGIPMYYYMVGYFQSSPPPSHPLRPSAMSIHLCSVVYIFSSRFMITVMFLELKSGAQNTPISLASIRERIRVDAFVVIKSRDGNGAMMMTTTKKTTLTTGKYYAKQITVRGTGMLQQRSIIFRGGRAEAEWGGFLFC